MTALRVTVALAAVLAVAACGGRRSHLSIEVSPASATFDVPFTVHVRGVPAHAQARIRFSGRTHDGRTAQYRVARRADAQGRVALADFYLYPHLDPTGQWPTRLTITASSGSARASTHAERRFDVAAKLSSTDERPAKVGFYGEWITPSRADHHTAILLFGGSEGGLTQQTLARVLAAHGYPVLELAYFSEPGLPPALTRVPLEYFERALRWLAKQPEADPSRIVTFGASRGGEASLLIASMFPRLVGAAVGYVPSATIIPSPSDDSSPAWTYHGKPVYGDRKRFRAFLTREDYGWIRVEHIRGPVFVVGGDADNLWPSGYSVQQIEKRMHAHGRRDITALFYPEAGHEIGQAFPRQVAVSRVGYGYVPSRYGTLNLGGSPHADEAALEDSWPKLLTFLGRLRSHS